MVAMTPEVERAVVEAEAMAEPCTATIERDGRHEDGVEESRALVLVTLGLMHAERVSGARFAESHEAHHAAAQRSDAGEIDLTPAGEGEPDQGIRAELLRHR